MRERGRDAAVPIAPVKLALTARTNDKERIIGAHDRRETFVASIHERDKR